MHYRVLRVCIAVCSVQLERVQVMQSASLYNVSRTEGSNDVGKAPGSNRDGDVPGVA
jgi:hypothetical protein